MSDDTGFDLSSRFTFSSRERDRNNSRRVSFLGAPSYGSVAAEAARMVHNRRRSEGKLLLRPIYYSKSLSSRSSRRDDDDCGYSFSDRTSRFANKQRQGGRKTNKKPSPARILARMMLDSSDESSSGEENEDISKKREEDKEEEEEKKEGLSETGEKRKQATASTPDEKEAPKDSSQDAALLGSGSTTTFVDMEGKDDMKQGTKIIGENGAASSAREPPAGSSPKVEESRASRDEDDGELSVKLVLVSSKGETRADEQQQQQLEETPRKGNRKGSRSAKKSGRRVLGDISNTCTPLKPSRRSKSSSGSQNKQSGREEKGSYPDGTKTCSTPAKIAPAASGTVPVQLGERESYRWA